MAFLFMLADRVMHRTKFLQSVVIQFASRRLTAYATLCIVTSYVIPINAPLSAAICFSPRCSSNSGCGQWLDFVLQTLDRFTQEDRVDQWFSKFEHAFFIADPRLWPALFWLRFTLQSLCWPLEFD